MFRLAAMDGILGDFQRFLCVPKSFIYLSSFLVKMYKGQHMLLCDVRKKVYFVFLLKTMNAKQILNDDEHQALLPFAAATDFIFLLKWQLTSFG